MWATVVDAQSSVTLYGLLDAGVTYANNQHVSGSTGHSNVQATGGNLNFDRWRPARPDVPVFQRATVLRRF